MILNFRKDLLSGKTMIGTIVTQPNAAMAEIIANVGFDWLLKRFWTSNER
jgi:2-keto-3-deoxy-L-rhamnonate aldolase RhmA